MARSKAWRASNVSRSPMCWLRKTSCPTADGDRVLQMPAHCKHRGDIAGHANSQRRIAASASQDSSAPSREPYDRVVAGAHDGPVVHQKMIGDVFQPSSRFFIGDGDRLVAAVAAGRDQRKRTFAHQQMMQRRIRQHDSEIWRAVRHIPRDVGAGLGTQQHNRCSLRFEQFLFRGRDLAVLARHLERRHHQREWLLFAMLALAQAGHGGRLAGVDQRVGIRRYL